MSEKQKTRVNKEKEVKNKAERSKMKSVFSYIGKSLLFIVLAAGIGAGTATYLFFRSSQDVIVPDVANLTKAQAAEKLSEKGFNSYKVVETDAASNINKISRSNPPAGAITKNQNTITLFLNVYKGTDISNFTGKTAADAVNTLTNDFQIPKNHIKIEYAYNTSIATGQVIKQNKEKNVNLENDTIILTVSKGAELIKLENPVDKPFTDVQAQLLSVGISANALHVTYQNDSSIAIGNVISISPAVNEWYDLAKNTPINLVVSNGTTVPTIKVPNLTGNSYAQALATLTGLGIDPSHISYSGVQTGTVQSQTIPANQLVDKGNVYLTLNMTVPKSAQKPVDMIDLNSLKGLAVQNAENLLVTAGVSVQIKPQQTNSTPENTVISASKNGDTIDLLVAVPTNNPPTVPSSSSTANPN